MSKGLAARGLISFGCQSTGFLKTSDGLLSDFLITDEYIFVIYSGNYSMAGWYVLSPLANSKKLCSCSFY